MHSALEGIIERVGLPAIERGLRRGSSLTEAIMACKSRFDGMLDSLHLQIKYRVPWALLVHFEPAAKKEELILNPNYLFQICPPKTTKSNSLTPKLGRYECTDKRQSFSSSDYAVQCEEVSYSSATELKTPSAFNKLCCSVALTAVILLLPFLCASTNLSLQKSWQCSSSLFETYSHLKHQ